MNPNCIFLVLQRNVYVYPSFIVDKYSIFDMLCLKCTSHRIWNIRLCLQCSIARKKKILAKTTQR